MARKKSIGRFAVGQQVRVRPGVTSPEFPDVLIEGWTGTVSEVSGKTPPVNCVIEWDAKTLAAMPQTYIDRCEEQRLYHPMTALSEEQLDSA